MLIRTHLGFRSLTLLGFAGMLYSGCVSSAPPKPTNTASAGGNDGSAAAPNSAGGDVGAEAGEAGNAGEASGATTSSGGVSPSGSGGSGAGGSAAGIIDSGGASGGAAGEGGAQEIAGGGAGTSGAMCGGAGQACCATGSTCKAGLACLGGATCSCLAGLYDWYVVRADGSLLYEGLASNSPETPVLDATTAKPLTSVSKAAGGYGFGCAIRGSDNEVWCWREVASGNNQGEIGSGTTDASGPVFRATPVLSAPNQPLKGAASLTSNKANPSAMCAAMTSGGAFCWGAIGWLTNLGADTYSPYAVALTSDGLTSLTGVKALSFDNETACAVIQGGAGTELRCWGYNGGNELGQGDTMSRRYPTKVLGLSAPSAVALCGADGYSGSTICAADGGGVLCWGRNSGYLTATGKMTNTVLAPTTVIRQDKTPLMGITDIVPAGIYNVGGFCAVNASHVPLCWGEGFGSYPDVYVAPNLVSIGNISEGTYGATVTYLSNDGVYHIGSYTRTPTCGALQ